MWFKVLVLISLASTSSSMNRPVYKVVLQQKGYTQFLQYDIETPPIREFTLCTWIRIYEFGRGDQTIFSYVASGHNRVIRLWVDSGGHNIVVSINGKTASTTPIELTKDVWRHICLSYQSDYGAWAIYMDSRLMLCQASHNIQNFVFPGSGSIIMGYGSNTNGVSSGLHGEIFGTNMILASTIERNFTLRNNPSFAQKKFRKNQMKTDQMLDYVILNDLQTGNNLHSFETKRLPNNMKKTGSYIKVNTPHTSVDHEVGVHLNLGPKPNIPDTSSTTEAEFDINFYNLRNHPALGGHKKPIKSDHEPHSANTGLSEYETPPPPPVSFMNMLDTVKNKPFLPTFEDSKPKIVEPSEIEVPPPVNSDANVYGQWTSSMFAGSVLNYLKNIKLYSRDQKKVPQTIPLKKLSDSFPYSSNLKLTKLRPPSQFQRRNIVEKFDVNKRGPKINVQILDDAPDLRTNIIQSHARTRPKKVDVTNRGRDKHKNEHRFYRAVNAYQESEEEFENSESSPNPNLMPIPTTDIKLQTEQQIQTNNLLAILPFLKSLEYFTERNNKVLKNPKVDEMVTKTLSDIKKWHNLKSYTNDYANRDLTNIHEYTQNDAEETVTEKKRAPVRVKYKQEDKKIVKYNDESAILQGRELAMQISNRSEPIKDPLSLVKYNHGYLPGRASGRLPENKIEPQQLSSNKKNTFHRHIKIGNALNERQVIGKNEEQNKQSFVGGHEFIPDINKYRSTASEELNDGIGVTIPSSLSPTVCKTQETDDPILYVQPDERIDVTHIASPVRSKNIGIEFVIQNYKKCSLQESDLQSNSMLYIDWSRTPVRLFGGAFPIKTTDLCGFFK